MIREAKIIQWIESPNCRLAIQLVVFPSSTDFILWAFVDSITIFQIVLPFPIIGREGLLWVLGIGYRFILHLPLAMSVATLKLAFVAIPTGIEHNSPETGPVDKDPLIEFPIGPDIEAKPIEPIPPPIAHVDIVAGVAVDAPSLLLRPRNPRPVQLADIGRAGEVVDLSYVGVESLTSRVGQVVQQVAPDQGGRVWGLPQVGGQAGQN